MKRKLRLHGALRRFNKWLEGAAVAARSNSGDPRNPFGPMDTKIILGEIEKDTRGDEPRDA